MLSHLLKGFLLSFVFTVIAMGCGKNPDWPIEDWVLLILFMTPFMTVVFWFNAGLMEFIDKVWPDDPPAPPAAGGAA